MAAGKSRRRRRRGRFGFLYKLLSFLLILGAVVGGCIVFFRVETVTVTGSTAYSDEEIIAAAEVEQGDNLFLVWRVPTAQKILKSLPYVKEVSLRRALPDGLVIHVTECVPAGVLQDENGAWWVMDSSGKLLEQGGSELTQKYARIDGLTPLMPSAGEKLAVSVEESVKLDALKQLLPALESYDLLGQIQKIDLTGAAEIHMTYDGRIDVRMPMYGEDFSHLVLVVQQAVETALNLGQTGTLDLITSVGEAHFIPD